MPNSDHANFAADGIPALRLVAGFERPESRVNAILSGDDPPAVVPEDALRRALRVTCAMAWQALKASDQTLERLARRPQAHPRRPVRETCFPAYAGLVLVLTIMTIMVMGVCHDH